MDEFAQSRGDDDLFDDDIIPLEPHQEVDTITRHVHDISLENAPKGPAAGTHFHHGYGSRNERGRGRGGRGKGRERGAERGNSQQDSTLLESKHAPASRKPNHVPDAHAPSAIPSGASKSSDGKSDPTSAPENDLGDQPFPTMTPTAEPSTPARPPAVRGDRTATGGIKKPKLTEEELTAKLAAAKTRSENISAAHARAEADAASFAERERAAAAKRTQDAANRRVMEGEREKNRARKMAVMGGREWDAEKNDEDFKVAAGGRGRGSHMRSSNGGVGLIHEAQAGAGRGQNRRRGRGSERGAPGSRGGHRNGAVYQPDLTVEADFPSLPPTARPKNEKPAAPAPEQKRTSLQVLSPTAGVGSWADQVEVSEAAKPKAGG
jgi:hypothetical protein